MSPSSKVVLRTLLRVPASLSRECGHGAGDRGGAGLDVHKKTVAACLRVPGSHGERVQEVRTFGTTTAELLVLRDWLEAHGVTHVAMESTGVYWKPIFYVLEEAVTCVLANAAQIAQVPGRKTDVKDCAWIAQLLEHGLIRGSFVPPAPIRDLRDLTRYRKGLIQERTRQANRLHKVLEDAGIKLASVATDVLGVSGRAMLQALVTGTRDPEVLADLARGNLRKKLPALRQALAGRFRPHHGFLVAQILAHLDYLDESIDAVNQQIDVVMAPFAIVSPSTTLTTWPASVAGICPSASTGTRRESSNRMHKPIPLPRYDVASRLGQRAHAPSYEPLRRSASTRSSASRRWRSVFRSRDNCSIFCSIFAWDSLSWSACRTFRSAMSLTAR